MLSFLIFRFSIKIPRGLSIVKNTIHGLCKKKQKNKIALKMDEEKVSGWRGKGGSFLWQCLVTVMDDFRVTFRNTIYTGTGGENSNPDVCFACIFLQCQWLNLKQCFDNRIVGIHTSLREGGGGGVITEFTYTIYGVIKKRVIHDVQSPLSTVGTKYK